MILDHFDLRDLVGLSLVEQQRVMEAFLDRWRAPVAGRRALLFVDESRGRVLVLRRAPAVQVVAA